MGRPIKKKFFANLNAPYQDQATGGPTGYGGEGVASYGTIVVGTGWTTAPTVTVSAPNMSFGGAATATVAAHYKALSGAVTANGTGYDWHDVLTIGSGTGTKPQFEVSGITVVAATVVGGGTGYAVGDTITFSTGNASNVVVTVATITGPGPTGPVATVSITAPGVRNAAKPANPVTADGTSGTGDGLATFTLTWGVYSLTATPVVAGDMTVFSNASSATSVSPAGGTGATVTVTYGLLSVAVLTAGSGYTTVADAAISFSGATGAAATAVLTSSYDNGLTVAAFVAGGASGVIGDIMKQEASRRYLVKTAQGQSQCKLVAVDTGSLAEGEMNLIATDSLGSTYYVTKLTARRATLTQQTDGGGGFEFASGDVANWTMDAATTGIVSLANA